MEPLAEKVELAIGGRLHDLPPAVWLVIGTSLIYILAKAVQAAVQRPPLPEGTPKLLTAGPWDWPVLGALRFFSDRSNFIMDGVHSSSTGSFSFYFGQHHIVAVSGVEGRKSFFESKQLSMSEGYAVLFTGAPQPVTSGKGESAATESGKSFIRTIVALMKADPLAKNLAPMVSDAWDSLQAKAPPKGEWAIMDPFDNIYRVVYRLTMRTVGTAEIYRDPKLLEKTLRMFENIADGCSPARIIFPWLPTWVHMRKMVAAGRLYTLLRRFLNDRKKTGRREDDALQFMMDNGDDDMIQIISFILGALFAGQINSGVNAAWILVFLSTTPEWHKKLRHEVDSVVARHRRSPDQTATDILATLTLEEWESEFPLIELCQRETIRMQLVGAAIRRNNSGTDVPIGKTGEVIPKDAFAVYQIDDTHFNPEFYPEPGKWDPSRYLPSDGKSPPPYLGWGIARHPCLGMKFAKLEMNIIAALFVGMFDFSLQDINGNPMETVPPVDRSRHGSHKPDTPMRLRFKLRED
ncbi:cytochrome P450 6A1 [Lasiosphaeris hirsuta]|uniref:Cytochrome P450 6A1 n=1 Tax=Lasiosphaeris hirsuta TaxID=260670 RepID=A0AA40AQY9_9PEZI|nr:cytochrome P450 6A1 [Lasiosphaeris hirsuta]